MWLKLVERVAIGIVVFIAGLGMGAVIGFCLAGVFWLRVVGMLVLVPLGPPAW